MLALLALAVAASAGQPLAPTSKWVVQYDDDMCVLARGYADGDNTITLALHPYPRGTSTEVILIERGTSGRYQMGAAELTLLPAEHVARGNYIRYTTDDHSKRLSRLSLDEDALQGIESASALTVRIGDHETHTLATPNIASAMRALRTCQADLLKTWGIDPAEQAAVAIPPKADVVSMFGPSDYPSAALKASEQGRAIAVVGVSAAGSTTTCTIVSSSHSPSLDDATCKVLRRGRFIPGRDKDGNAVASHLVVPIRWSLPYG